MGVSVSTKVMLTSEASFSLEKSFFQISIFPSVGYQKLKD